jgi:hypothetical protein
MPTQAQPQPRSRRAWPIIACGLSLLLALAVLHPPPAAAMPPRPPRPTAPPATVTPSQRTLIVLLFALPPATLPDGWRALWTGIQWQDGAGAWHDVEGWQGALDEVARGVGKKTWAVADGHLGGGPYRWLIYARPDGDVVMTSRPFYLPSAAGDIYEIELAMPWRCKPSSRRSRSPMLFHCATDLPQWIRTVCKEVYNVNVPVSAKSNIVCSAAHPQRHALPKQSCYGILPDDGDRVLYGE